MKNKLHLFVRGFVLAASMFLLMNLGKFNEISAYTLISMLLASLLIGYCFLKFAPRFWRDYGYDEKAF